MRMHAAVPGMTSLTRCQGKKTRLRVRKDPAEYYDMTSLTRCQANSISVILRKVRRGPDEWHEITHFLSSQQDQSKCEDSEKRSSWTWHDITYFLSGQQDQCEKSEKGHSWT